MRGGRGAAPSADGRVPGVGTRMSAAKGICQRSQIGKERQREIQGLGLLMRGQKMKNQGRNVENLGRRGGWED